ncbi:MAG: hypothetical protein ACR2PT_12065 [Endozoicomonas sp.]
MKRLYYLTDTLGSVSKISDDLHQDGITDWNIHVLSKDEAGLYHRHVHSAHLFQQNDVIHSGEQGAIIGGLIGLVIALALETQAFFEHSLPLLVLLAIAGLFTLFGAWSGGLAGVTRENYKIQRFHSDLEKGKHLIMVDVLRNQELLIRQQLSQYHPEAVLAAEGTSLIHPFSYNFWVTPRQAH